MQGPVLDINMRGIKIDLAARNRAIDEYMAIVRKVETNLDIFIREGVGSTTANWRSPQQLQNLLYSVMGFPEQKFHGKVTVRRNALEKLAEGYFLAQPIISHILCLRDIWKKVSTLKTRVDSDGRIRTSVNISGTNTGRFSSSLSEFEEAGGNLQNIEERLRRVFIADRGKKFAYIDLEQAESRAVGAICWNRFRMSNYLDVCESGDLHTNVVKMTNPGLPWTGDAAKDKDIAEQPFYRQHSYRHMNKILGHGSNYEGQPPQMSIHTHIDTDIIKDFQSKYFRAFPEIPIWHQWTKDALWRDGYLINLMGRRRWFFGRRNDPEVQRAAIAYDPQGSVAQILNTGMLQVWRLNITDLLLQVHDAILVQYNEEREDEILPKLLEAIVVPVPLEHNRTLVIPSEAKVGWNWANFVPEFDKEGKPNKDSNPDGLIKYKGHDKRTRSENTETSIVDRLVRSIS
jgi:DNA polymerase I-like protein with 3'-5' exonuclease and polymerase domains